MAGQSSFSVVAFKSKTWARDGFLISTDPTLIPIPALTAAFDSPDLYWAKALPEDVMREMVDNSLCFGLYTPTPIPHTDTTPSNAPSTQAPPSPYLTAPPSRPATAKSTSSYTSSTNPSLIGFARTITDYTTFLYLTDVYVLSEWRGQGLGAWLIDCVQEVAESMPHLRRTMLITSNERAASKGGQVGLYEKRMGMSVLGEGGGGGRKRTGSVLERVVEGLGGGDEHAKELVAMSWRGPGSMV